MKLPIRVVGVDIVDEVVLSLPKLLHLLITLFIELDILFRRLGNYRKQPWTRGTRARNARSIKYSPRNYEALSKSEISETNTLTRFFIFKRVTVTKSKYINNNSRSAERGLFYVCNSFAFSLSLLVVFHLKRF